MKPTALLRLSAVISSALALSGCALVTGGLKQSVIVRSTPSGAAAKINGVEVGSTPFQVELRRNEVYRVDLSKDGFATASSVVLPSTRAYDARNLRWGVDYQTGAAAELIPAEMSVTLEPVFGAVTGADAYSELSAQVTRADSLLAAGQLSSAEHKVLMQRIIAAYSRIN